MPRNYFYRLYGKCLFYISKHELYRFGLPKSTSKLIGEEVFVNPFPGWGWFNNEGCSIEIPPPFTVRLVSLKPESPRYNAGTAVVIEKDHIFSESLLEFSVRHVGDVTLNNKCHYNVHLHNGEKHYSGYAEIYQHNENNG